MSTVRALDHHVQPKRQPSADSVSFKLLEKHLQQQDKTQVTSLLTVGLLVLAVAFISMQLVRGTMLNFDRYVTLSDKYQNLESLNEKVTYQNAVLKKTYKNYTSREGLESLARDYLNLVGDNEIAVVIKKG